MENNNQLENPVERYPAPPYQESRLDTPGHEADMQNKPDHGEESYKGSGKLKGRRAIITGGDSGIGRAVAIAFAREGADVLIAYLNEDDDAKVTAEFVERAGQKAVLVPGDISQEQHCNDIIEKAVAEFGGLDIIVN
ncbi:MAG: SDR family NAD(P)-dependent oxidoreductase, partial [Flavobacterium sp.]